MPLLTSLSRSLHRRFRASLIRVACSARKGSGTMCVARSLQCEASLTTDECRCSCVGSCCFFGEAHALTTLDSWLWRSSRNAFGGRQHHDFDLQRKSFLRPLRSLVLILWFTARPLDRRHSPSVATVLARRLRRVSVLHRELRPSLWVETSPPTESPFVDSMPYCQCSSTAVHLE